MTTEKSLIHNENKLYIIRKNKISVRNIYTWSYNFVLHYLQSKAVTFVATIANIMDIVLVIPSNFEEDLMKTCKGLTFLWANYMDKPRK